MALLVLLAGIAAAMKLFPAGLAAGRRATESTDAAIVGQAALDYVKALGYDENDGFQRPLMDEDDHLYVAQPAAIDLYDWDRIRQKAELGQGADLFVDFSGYPVGPNTPLYRKAVVAVGCYGVLEGTGASVSFELVDGGMHMPVMYQYKVTVSVPVQRSAMPIRGVIGNPSASGPNGRWAVVDGQLRNRFDSVEDGRSRLVGRMLELTSGEGRGLAFLITDYASGGKIILRWESPNIRSLVQPGDRYRISDRRDFVTYIGRM